MQIMSVSKKEKAIKEEEMDKVCYVGSGEFALSRIEIFSFSGLCVPFYHFTIPATGENAVIGGVRGGRLTDMEDPMWEARDAYYFLTNICYYAEHGESMTDYTFAKRMHKKVADSGEIECRVLVDQYSDGKVGLGASNYLYWKDANGQMMMCLDDVLVEQMFGADGIVGLNTEGNEKQVDY